MTSARWVSIAASVASASKRGNSTRWLPCISPSVAQTAGPLWYSGPGTTMHSSGRTCSIDATSVSRTAGSPDTISFGRPVLPPDVGAFQAGDAASRSSMSGSATSIADRPSAGSRSAGTFDRAARRARRRTRRANSPARRSPPARAAGAGPTPAAAPRRPARSACWATNQSIELGSAIVTMSPCRTPLTARSRASSSAASRRSGAGDALLATRDGRPIGRGLGVRGEQTVAGDDRHRVRSVREVRGALLHVRHHRFDLIRTCRSGRR